MSFNIIYTEKFSLVQRNNLAFVLNDILFNIISPQGLFFDYKKADKSSLKDFFALFENSWCFVKKEKEGAIYRIAIERDHLRDLLLLVRWYPYSSKVSKSYRDSVYQESFHISQDIKNFNRTYFKASFSKQDLPISLSSVEEFTQTFRQVIFSEEFFIFEFFISKKVCEEITFLPYNIMREMDLWIILNFWQNSAFSKKLKTYTPLCQILSDIKDEKPTCLNEDNLTLSELGEVYYVPSKINKVDFYERLFNSVRENSKYGFSRNVLHKDTPINRIILTDWKNNILSYTNGYGNLEILNLSNFRKLTASHASNVFERVDVSPSLLSSLDRFITALSPHILDFDVDFDNFLSQACPDIPRFHYKKTYGSSLIYNIMGILSSYNAKISSFWDNEGSFKLKYFHEDNPLLKYYFPLFRKIIKIVEQDPIKLEKTYSIPHALKYYGLIKTLVKYNSSSSNLSALVEEEVKDALYQNIETNWQVPALPLLSDSVRLLPHQKKILNIMKDNPKYAIFPVSAGGGKSLLAILDILKNIKEKKNFPYLIICPTHLVSQYIREIVYFTQGKLNAIPLTTSVIQTQGLDRLQDIISQAPLNTVVIASYDVLKYKSHTIGYGSYELDVFPIQRFLKSFSFQYCLLDESQTIKNFTSQRSKAARELVTSIPNVRLASGTMAHNTIADLVAQIGILNPSIFGSLKDFIRIYALKSRKGWKAGTEALVMKRISNNVVVGKALRKEWAALLPPKYEKIHVVNLTEKQQELYRVLLGEVLEEIQSNKILMQKLTQHKESFEENLSEVEESLEDDIASMLAVYLQKLEIFTAAPYETNIGKILEEEDRISPKVKKVLDIIKDHIDEEIDGKIIVYCQNVAVAEAVYKASALSEYKLQKSGILYKASEKYKHIDNFEKNDSKKWMVGVETSMNTGLNLQIASRLIRIQYTWTPGSLEQGNSRINRPQLKISENRPNIYFDWIVASRTVDICKMARLVAKLISVSKFDNSHNEDYLNLPDLPPIPMTLDSIRKEMEQEYLSPYIQAYGDYNKLVNNEYASYRESHLKELDENGNMKLTPVPTMPSENCFYIQTPFIENMDIYKSEELGLIRGDEAEILSENQPVYTEFGCGYIQKINKNNVQINLGLRVVSLPSSKIFLTSSVYGTDTIRKKLKEKIGLPYKAILQHRKITSEKVEKPLVLKPLVLNNHFFLAYPCSGNYKHKMILENLGFSYYDLGYLCSFTNHNIKRLITELKSPLFKEIFNLPLSDLFSSWKTFYKVSKKPFSQETLDSFKNFSLFEKAKTFNINVTLINKKYYFQILPDSDKGFLRSTSVPFKTGNKFLLKEFPNFEDMKKFLEFCSLNAVGYEEYKNFIFSNSKVL